MNLIVCDTCSLIKLEKGGVTVCLGEFYDKVYIPEAVKNECSDGDRSNPGNLLYI